MRDKSGALVAPTGSGLGSTPADSGGHATLPRAPGHARPPVAPPSAAGLDRLSAAPRAPGPDVPLATPAGAPGQDCLSAALATPSAHDRPHVSPPPPPDRDRSRRASATAGAPPASVTHPTTPDQGLYDLLFTAAEVQALEQAADAPVLDAEARLLQVLIRRLLAIDPDQAHPPGRRRGGAGRRWQHTLLLKQAAAIGRAADVLQRLLKTQQTLAKDSPSELFQLLDEAAQYMENPPPPDEQLADAHDEIAAAPSDIPTFKPLTYPDPP